MKGIKKYSIISVKFCQDQVKEINQEIEALIIKLNKVDDASKSITELVHIASEGSQEIAAAVEE